MRRISEGSLINEFPYPPDALLMKSVEGDSKGFRRKQWAVHRRAEKILRENPDGEQAAFQKLLDDKREGLGLPMANVTIPVDPDKSALRRGWRKVVKLISR